MRLVSFTFSLSLNHSTYGIGFPAIWHSILAGSPCSTSISVASLTISGALPSGLLAIQMKKNDVSHDLTLNGLNTTLLLIKVLFVS